MGGFRPSPLKYVYTIVILSYNNQLSNFLSDKDGSVIKPAVPYGMDVHLKFMCETPHEFTMNNSKCCGRTIKLH